MARKRKPGPRTPSGRLSRAYTDPRLRDFGTEEMRAKRLELVGEGADPALAATMPGVLHARGHLDRDQYAAALEYRKLRCALYGPPWPTNVPGGEASDMRLARLQERYDAMCSRLTLIQTQVLRSVCVFDEPPMWFRRQLHGLRMREVDRFERRVLIEGLDVLIGGGQRKAA